MFTISKVFTISSQTKNKRWLQLQAIMGVCKGLFVPLKTGVSVSPSPMEVLYSNSTGLQGQILWGFPVPLSGPQAGKPDVGFWTFRIVELLQYYCSPVCGSPTWQVWDLILLWLCPSYHIVVTSLSLDMGLMFLVGSRVLLTVVVQLLVVMLVLL